LAVCCQLSAAFMSPVVTLCSSFARRRPVPRYRKVATAERRSTFFDRHYITTCNHRPTPLCLVTGMIFLCGRLTPPLGFPTNQSNQTILSFSRNRTETFAVVSNCNVYYSSTVEVRDCKSYTHLCNPSIIHSPMILRRLLHRLTDSILFCISKPEQPKIRSVRLDCSSRSLVGGILFQQKILKTFSSGSISGFSKPK
jgi:hypothetical protein